MEKDLLYRFFNGEATVEEEKQVLDWVDADPSHRKQLFAERRMFDAMLMHAQGQQLPAVSRKGIFVLPRWTRAVANYAAVVLVVVGIGGFFVSRAYDRLLQGENTISVPAGQHVDVVLSDGTKVCVNALSELKYPAFFARKNRKVQLTGEAFFEVAHNAERPFIVETTAHDVEVLGTKFDVDARSANQNFSTALVEGAVRVVDRSNPGNSVVLKPSERVECINGTYVVERMQGTDDFLWREGILSFRDASFSELLGEFEKYYGVTIELQRPDVKAKPLTGKIRISEGVDHALRVLQRNADFRFSRNETKDVIYIQ